MASQKYQIKILSLFLTILVYYYNHYGPYLNSRDETNIRGQAPDHTAVVGSVIWINDDTYRLELPSAPDVTKNSTQLLNRD